MKIIEATFNGEVYKFDADAIGEFVENHQLTDEQLQDVADILAANVELPITDENCVVEICRSNFNDAFRDMEEELTDMYGQ